MSGNILGVKTIISTLICYFVVIIDSVSMICPILLWSTNPSFAKIDGGCCDLFINCLSSLLFVEKFFFFKPLTQ